MSWNYRQCGDLCCEAPPPPLLPSSSPEPKQQSIEQWIELTWPQKPTAKSKLQWTSLCQATNTQEGLHWCLGPPLRPNRGLTAHPGPTQKEEPTTQAKEQQTDPKLRKDTSHDNQGTGAHPEQHRATQPSLHPKTEQKLPHPRGTGLTGRAQDPHHANYHMQGGRTRDRDGKETERHVIPRTDWKNGSQRKHLVTFSLTKMFYWYITRAAFWLVHVFFSKLYIGTNVQPLEGSSALKFP